MDSVSSQMLVTATSVNVLLTLARFKLTIPPDVRVTALVRMALLRAQINTVKRVSTQLGHNGRHVIGRVVWVDKSVSSSTCSKTISALINRNTNRVTVISARVLTKTEPCGQNGDHVRHRAVGMELNTAI